ncbi:MAG: hypothetical protein QOJ74_1252, partial [Ilumatobacteraceae bacterium]|nr:hypothetical protein [Ilumatobacteraceae bacterium]
MSSEKKTTNSPARARGSRSNGTMAGASMDDAAGSEQMPGSVMVEASADMAVLGGMPGSLDDVTSEQMPEGGMTETLTDLGMPGTQSTGAMGAASGGGIGTGMAG